MTAKRILALNFGSSSLKYAVFAVGAEEKKLAGGGVENLDEVLAAIDERKLGPLDGIGHRIVHGGVDHVDPETIDERLLGALERLVPFAPVHLPAEIELARRALELAPGVPQVACFDTAFHRRMPLVAQRLPLSEDLWLEGIRRYGFHGLSYESIVDTIGGEALGRAVLAHLGNGSSLAAVKGGEPIDTTMGFTPTGGCMMGTRSGDLDPGVLVYLVRHHGYDGRALDRAVNREAGLAGISGGTSDVRALLAKRDHDDRAALAVEAFCRSVRKHVGALAAALGGMDTLVFTGGIGEHASPIRAEIARGLEHLGVEIDERRNAEHAAVASAQGARCTVRIVATEEERMIARHTGRRIAAGRP